MAEKEDINDILQELEKLTEDVEDKKPNVRKKGKKKKSVSNIPDKKIKEDLNKVKELKKSIDILEKEVFIKIDDPESIINNLLESKKKIKDITNNLLALIKINKLRDELLERMDNDLNTLKDLSKDIEKELNLEQYSQSLGDKVGDVNGGMISQYVDTVEEDIEEIKKYIGVAK